MVINNSIRRYGQIQKTREYTEIVKMMIPLGKTWMASTGGRFSSNGRSFSGGSPASGQRGSSTGRTSGNRFMEVGWHSAADGRSGGINSYRYG